MDALFWTPLILQSSDQQQSSFNSNITSTSFNSRQYPDNNYKNYQHQEEEEECFNPFMDGDDFSSSHQPPTATPPYALLHESSSSAMHDQHYPASNFPHHDLTLEFNSLISGKWSSDILLEAARAFSERNSTRLHELMWMINELSSPYGDTDQKLAHYFLQALFSRVTDSGYKSYCNLTSSAERNLSFEATRRNILKFQEVSPWTTFGHTACNGAIMEAFQGESKLHIIDFSNTFCTQWPTLLESLATCGDETPCLRLTAIVHSGSSALRVMREIGYRMEKFARLMAVPFKFNAINQTGNLWELDLNLVNIVEEEALVINCVGSLHSVKSDGRDIFISMIRRLQPRIVTVVEEEADLDVGVEGKEFVKGFEECLRWFRVYFECLDDSFPKTSKERLALERSAGRAVVDLVACPASESKERRETSTQWSRRFHEAGFRGVMFSDEVSDEVRLVLRRHKEGWSMSMRRDSGMLLMWKDQPVVWASAWKPSLVDLIGSSARQP